MAFLAAAAPILGLVGAGASAFGSIEAGNYSGEVASNNATIATQNAEYAREAGQEQAAITSRKGAAQGAAIKTGLAANGVDVNTGSAVGVEAGERETSNLDAETVLNNAELTAYGYTTQASNFNAQAQQDVIGGDIGAAGSLLSNASSIGMKWSSGNGAGVSGNTGEWAGSGSSF